MKFSPTALTTYTTNCQRRFFLDKLHPQPFGGPAAEHGIAVHDAFEQVCRLMAEKGKTAEEACDIARACAPSREIAGYIDRALPVFMGLKPARGRIEAWLPWGGNPQFTGKVDCVSHTTPIWSLGELAGFEDGPCLIDWKTTENPDRVMTEIDARRSLQSVIYCSRMEIPRISFIYFLPDGAAMGCTVRFSPEELAEKLARVGKTCAEIEQKMAQGEEAFSLHPSPGRGLCRGPEVSYACPHWVSGACPVGQGRP